MAQRSIQAGGPDQRAISGLWCWAKTALSPAQTRPRSGTFCSLHLARGEDQLVERRVGRVAVVGDLRVGGGGHGPVERGGHARHLGGARGRVVVVGQAVGSRRQGAPGAAELARAARLAATCAAVAREWRASRARFSGLASLKIRSFRLWTIALSPPRRPRGMSCFTSSMFFRDAGVRFPVLGAHVTPSAGTRSVHLRPALAD